MVNINLTTSGSQLERKGFPYKKGLIVMILVLLLLGGAHLGIILLKNYTIAQTSIVNDQYKSEYDKLISESNKSVVDFQSRMAAAKKLVNQDNTALDALLQVEKSILPGVYISSYEYDDNKKILTLENFADDFNLVAKQILSFKQLDYFLQVAPEKTGIDTNGKVKFQIELKVK